jgi:hypothetical protein
MRCRHSLSILLTNHLPFRVIIGHRDALYEGGPEKAEISDLYDFRPNLSSCSIQSFIVSTSGVRVTGGSVIRGNTYAHVRVLSACSAVLHRRFAHFRCLLLSFIAEEMEFGSSNNC